MFYLGGFRCGSFIDPLEYLQITLKRAQEIAQAENLDGQPLDAYIKLVNRCKSNFRMVLQEIEKGYMLK